jgi:hypothetical protein
MYVEIHQSYPFADDLEEFDPCLAKFKSDKTMDLPPKL